MVGLAASSNQCIFTVIYLFERKTRTFRSSYANHQRSERASERTEGRKKEQTRNPFLQFYPSYNHVLVVLINVICILSKGLHVHGHGSTETYLTYVGQNMYELLVSFLFVDTKIL